MTSMNISHKYIKKIENLPNNLTEFYCWNNQIKVIENLPNSLIVR
jgi:Leucine-rich repeat (LRR) protein